MATATTLPSGARFIHKFLVHQENTYIRDIVTLPHGRVLVAVADSDIKALKLFNVQGELLLQRDTGELCRINKVEKSLVIVLYTESKRLEILNVEEADMKVQNSLFLERDKCYTSVVSVDRERIGVSFSKKYSFGVDIYDLDGVHMTTIDTRYYVNYMCSAEDGTIFCSNHRYGNITKIDVNEKKKLFCVKVPEVPLPCGLSYLTGSQAIVVCGVRHGNLSLLDNQGRFLKELYQSTSGGVYLVSVHDDTCVLEGHGMLYVLNLEF